MTGRCLYARARELCQKIGEAPQLLPVLGALVIVYGNWGEPREAREIAEQHVAVAEALAIVRRSGACWYEAELYRLQGEFLSMQGREREAEASFQRAIEVARRQSARSWELRATTSLGRLWHRQSKREKAQPRLAEIYGWFREGFDTPDLVDARALLTEPG